LSFELRDEPIEDPFGRGRTQHIFYLNKVHHLSNDVSWTTPNKIQANSDFIISSQRTDGTPFSLLTMELHSAFPELQGIIETTTTFVFFTDYSIFWVDKKTGNITKNLPTPEIGHRYWADSSTATISIQGDSSKYRVKTYKTKFLVVINNLGIHFNGYELSVLKMEDDAILIEKTSNNKKERGIGGGQNSLMQCAGVSVYFQSTIYLL